MADEMLDWRMYWGFTCNYITNMRRKMGELYISGKASLACWRAKCGETASLTNLHICTHVHMYIFVHTYCIYAVLFRFHSSPKKLISPVNTAIKRVSPGKKISTGQFLVYELGMSLPSVFEKTAPVPL